MNAELLQTNASAWPPATNIYRVSEEFAGSDHVAVTVGPFGTEVFPATAEGASIGHPQLGLISHRKWFPPIDHEQALTELGYEVRGV